MDRNRMARSVKTATDVMITGGYLALMPNICSPFVVSANSKGNIWLFSSQTLHIFTSLLLTLSMCHMVLSRYSQLKTAAAKNDTMSDENEPKHERCMRQLHKALHSCRELQTHGTPLWDRHM